MQNAIPANGQGAQAQTDKSINAMVFKVIRKESAVTQVADQILMQIRNNTLAPGSKLPSQRELSEQLGVGRSSVREAVNALVAKGYLAPIQGKGTFVRDVLPASIDRLEKLSAVMNVSSIFNLMEARMLLECKSAALAAQRAGKKDLKKFNALLAREDICQKAYDKFLEGDMGIHIAIAEATQNDIICEMTKLVLVRLEDYHNSLNMSQISQSYKRQSVDTISKVLLAIKDRNSEQAASWMERHLLLITDELSDIV